MPYAEGDPIRRQAELDALFLIGGVLLTFIAGYINVTSLMYFHVPVSHMSGVVSKISQDMALRDFHDMGRMAFIFGGFFAGATFSGFLIGGGNYKPRLEYCFVLLLESLFLLVALVLFKLQWNFGLVFVSMACGLQNAMASSYMGLIVRTTHMTGIVTDIGVLLGQSLKQGRFKAWKILFLSALLGGFFSGGFVALLIYRLISFYGLILPSLLCIGVAAAFYGLRVLPELRRIPA